jgi:hypothetical protein
MSKNIKETTSAMRTNLMGVYDMAITVAEVAAAYILYFSSTNQAFKIVAGVLLLDGAVKSAKAFVFKKSA